MKDERYELIKKALQEGKRRDDVRRELITNGFSTEGFEAQYQTAMKELGIEESTSTTSEPAFKLADRILSEKAIVRTITQTPSSKKWIRMLIEVVLLLVVIMLAAGLFRLYGVYQSKSAADKHNSEEGQPLNEFSFADSITKAQMTTLQISAEQYKRKLFDYGGLCISIGIPDDVFCSENIKEYAMESLLSSGLFYCIDSTEFSGITQSSKRDAFSCK